MGTKGSFKKGSTPWNKGKKSIIPNKNKGLKNIFSIDTIKKMSNSHKGKPAWNKGKKGIMPMPWNKGRTDLGGYKLSEEHKQKIGAANKGKGKDRMGNKTNNWKGGITPYYYLLRNLDEYKIWRMDCMKRDWFKCQTCSSKENLEVHHIVSFKQLLNEFLQKNSEFNMIQDREILIRLAKTYEPFYNLVNGQTLCEKCHKKLRRGL